MSEDGIFLKIYMIKHTYIYHIRTHMSHTYICIYIYTHTQFNKVICLSSKYCNRGIYFMTQSIRFPVTLKITSCCGGRGLLVPVAFKILLGPCLLVKHVWVWYQDNFDDIKSTF